MGLSISWIGVWGRNKEDVLADLNLADTGRPDLENRAWFSCAELPNGWLIVSSTKFDFASPKTIASVSSGGLAIGCAVEEHVMFSGVRTYEDGRLKWSVIHDSENGIYDLSIGGEPPAELADIRYRLTRQQDDSGGSHADVDFVFDIPIELAHAVCGFRHNGELPDPMPFFTELEPELPPRGPKGPGLGAWLSGLFRRGG